MGTETDLFNVVIPMPNTVFLSLLTLPTCFLLPGWLRQERICPQCKRPRFDPWVGKTPGEGKGYPHQYSGLENSMNSLKESDMTERLSLSLLHCRQILYHLSHQMVAYKSLIMLIILPNVYKYTRFFFQTLGTWVSFMPK